MELILSLVLAMITFVIGVRSFMEKGFLFNNAYIFASEQERLTMDKKPHYRQTGIVFCLLGLVFLSIAMAVLLRAAWPYYIAGALSFVTLVYAIASSVQAAKKA